MTVGDLVREPVDDLEAAALLAARRREVVHELGEEERDALHPDRHQLRQPVPVHG